MSMNSNDHAYFEELAAGHALLALEPEDEQAFHAHVRNCESCRRAVDEHSQTLAHLAYDAAGEAPPMTVLAGIQAGIRESGRAGAFPAPLPAPQLTSPVSLEAARVRRRDATVRWTTAVTGVAAAAAMVVALVIVNHGLSSRARQAQNAAAQLQTTIAQLLVPGARKIPLTGSHGGSGAVVIRGHDLSLVMTGVPVNERSNSIYVLWEKTSFGDVSAVGTFDVRSADVTVVNNLPLASGPGQAQAFIVTWEHGRTAPARSTQPPVIAGQV